MPFIWITLLTNPENEFAIHQLKYFCVISNIKKKKKFRKVAVEYILTCSFIRRLTFGLCFLMKQRNERDP